MKTANTKKIPGILYAMRYPEDIGMVWQSLLQLYSEVSIISHQDFQNIIAYPKLVNSSRVNSSKQIFLEANFYNTSESNKSNLQSLIEEFNIQAIVYISASTNEIDIKWLKKRGVQTINFEQESYDTFKTQSTWKAGLKTFLRRILKINLHSIYLANSLSQISFLLNFAKLPVSRIQPCVNGVDTNLFSPSSTNDFQKNNITNTQLVVLSIAQARDEKNIMFLIDVAKEVFKINPEISLSFVHVGDGHCLEAWKNYALESNLQDKFFFVGKHLDIRPFLQISTVLAHVAKRESFGYVLAEAMSYGKPIIATPSQGSKEIIADGHTGAIVNTNNPRIFAEKLISFLSDPEELSKMGFSARERAKCLFSVKRQAEDLSIIIKDLLNHTHKKKKFPNKISSRTLRADILNLPLLWRFPVMQNLLLKIVDLYCPNVTGRINTILQGFSKVFFVQIGSNDGKQADPLYQLSHSKSNWSGLLVEPLPFLFKKLKDNYPDPKFQLENSAIGESNGEITFYYISPEAKKVLGEKLPFYYDQVGSFSLNHVLKHFDSEIEQYILKTQVPTITLKNLLERHKIDKIDLLHIDTEGFDYQILRQINLRQFTPKIILFEHIHLPMEQKLMSQYFLFYNNYQILDLGRDFLAVKNEYTKTHWVLPNSLEKI